MFVLVVVVAFGAICVAGYRVQKSPDVRWQWPIKFKTKQERINEMMPWDGPADPAIAALQQTLAEVLEQQGIHEMRIKKLENPPGEDWSPKK